jgi:hypothetical protein
MSNVTDFYSSQNYDSFENAHEISKFTTVGENMYRSRTDIKRLLTERNRIGDGEEDVWTGDYKAWTEAAQNEKRMCK